MKTVNADVIMVGDGPTNMTMKQQIKGVSPLGREIKISPKTVAISNKEGYEISFYVPTVSMTLGVGNDHIIEVVMTEEAFDELLNGAEITYTTAKEFMGKKVTKKKKNK